MQTYGDAAKLAAAHIAALQGQIDMFTHVPPSLKFHPVAIRRAAAARWFVKKNLLATELFGEGKHEAARELGKMADDDVAAFDNWTRSMIHTFQFAAQDAGAIKLWSRYRIAYSIDPDLWKELGDADDDTELPVGILSRLPHPDPFIALPEPIVIEMRTPEGEEKLYERIEGFFVTGRFAVSEKGYLLTSTEYTPGTIALLLCAKIVRANGSHARNLDGRPDYAWIRISINDGHTVGELIDDISRGFMSTAPMMDWESEVVLSLRRCVSILLYLCATNADLQPIPSPPRKRVKGGRQVERSAARVVAVGWRLGAKLRAYKANPNAPRENAPTGRHMRPHVRRAHFHTVRIGPGRPNQRTETELRWISAVPVNFEHDADTTTVVGVPKKRKERK